LLEHAENVLDGDLLCSSIDDLLSVIGAAEPGQVLADWTFALHWHGGVGVLGELLEDLLEVGVAEHGVKRRRDVGIDERISGLGTLRDSPIHIVGDHLSLLSRNGLLLRNLAVQSVNELLATVEALLIIRWAEGGKDLLDSVLVHAASPNHISEHFTHVDLWQKGLLLWAELTVPLTLDLVPDRAVVVATSVVTDLNPADVIKLVRLVTLIVLTEGLALLLNSNGTIDAIVVLPLGVPVEEHRLLAGLVPRAWVSAPSLNAELTILALVDLALRSTRIVDDVTEPVTTIGCPVLIPLLELLIVPVLFIHVGPVISISTLHPILSSEIVLTLTPVLLLRESPIGT